MFSEDVQVWFFFMLGVAAPWGVYYAWREFRRRR